MKTTYQSFTELNVYKECRKFRKDVSIIVKQFFPSSEKFLLTSQILDASRSVTANIAEGHGRFYYKENARFCRVSRGSLEETLEHLITAFDEKYITAKAIKPLQEQQTKCLKLLNGYIRYLRSSKRGEEDCD